MKFFDIITNAELGTGRLFFQIPYETSTSFKEIFAGEWQWHHEHKIWSVPEMMRSRLEQWMSLVKPVAAPSAVASALHLTEKEIERTQAEVAAISTKLAAQNAARGTVEKFKTMLAESKALLVLRREEIAAREAEIEYDRQQRIEHQADVDAALAPIIDRAELRTALQIMTILETATNRRDLDQWRKAQHEVCKARNNLAGAGIALEAIDYLADYKDKIANMPPGAWYCLTRIKA